MKKHIFKRAHFFGELPFESQNIADPFRNISRSETTPHENRLNYSENSQKLLKNEEKKSLYYY